jgi:hypothetical protein
VSSSNDCSGGVRRKKARLLIRQKRMPSQS